MKYHLKNKVVWLTGASKGIGYHLATALIEAGAQLIVSARDTSVIADMPASDHIDCDVTQAEDVKRVVERIVAKHGGLDCIILNAGNAEYVNTKRFDSAVYERMMAVNFTSQVYAVEACLPHLRNSFSPYIVAMSSSVAWTGLSRGHAYSASKAASRNFFQGLALDLAREDIAVSVICPGFVRTPLTDKNDFNMPGLIEPETAAKHIMNGMQSMKPEISFPKRFTIPFRLITILPARLRFAILKRIL
jgi:NAD(P)-dependent dehydrogenase (short-subunit alcohol dehydrogenase family)